MEKHRTLMPVRILQRGRVFLLPPCARDPLSPSESLTLAVLLPSSLPLDKEPCFHYQKPKGLCSQSLTQSPQSSLFSLIISWDPLGVPLTSRDHSTHFKDGEMEVQSDEGNHLVTQSSQVVLLPGPPSWLTLPILSHYKRK